MIKATNKHTGEVITLPADTPERLVEAWQIAQEYAKTAEALKDQLKSIILKSANKLCSVRNPSIVNKN